LAQTLARCVKAPDEHLLVEGASKALSAVIHKHLQDLESSNTSDSLITLITQLMGTMQTGYDALRTALGRGERDRVVVEAHKLRGGVSTFGAEALAEVCCDIERQAQIGSFSERQALAARLEREYTLFCSATHQLLDQYRQQTAIRE
jgi:HPt (histidine-containing phosphotransfer) domain-containing protein